MAIIQARKKGIYFLLDALLFAILLIAGLSLFYFSSSSSIVYSHTQIIATDVMNVLEVLSVQELYEQGNVPIVSGVNDGKIVDTDGNVLSLITVLWSRGEDALAYDILESIVDQQPLDKYNLGLWIEQEPVFVRTTPAQNSQSVEWRIISGIEKNKPVRGFIANARANQVRGNGTKIVDISPLGAGWHAGHMEMTKFFDLTGKTIHSAQLIMSVHKHGSTNSVQVDMNQGQCYFDNRDFDWWYDDQGDVAVKDITSCVVSDMNEFWMHLNMNHYNAHTHPGMQIVIEYSQELEFAVQEQQVSKRYYFDNIESFEQGNFKAGVWSTLPFFIPEGATDIDVNMQVVANNVRNYNLNFPNCQAYYISNRRCTFLDWNGNYRLPNDYDYILFVNSVQPVDNDPSPDPNPIYSYDTSFFENHLVSGTNVVGVYFNNYGDVVWGSDWVRLYSDPINDPQGSSYIEVNYTLPANPIPPGTVKVSQRTFFEPPDSSDMQVSFTFPSQAVQKGDVFVYLTQRYSNLATVWADIYDPPQTQVYRSPGARIIPTAIYLDNSLFALSPSVQNYVRARDDVGTNEFVADLSWVLSEFYIPAYVGYGQPFDTLEEANQDALDRLAQVMEGFIESDDITVTSNSITNVPSLWGPALVEVRVWD
ncbi:MAG: hypothetical protein ACMXYF_00805 [Candidatus Woesearchaeota archaeon]